MKLASISFPETGPTHNRLYHPLMFQIEIKVPELSDEAERCRNQGAEHSLVHGK